ncbi:hypothetical protein [Pararhodospirillum oryzae]|uniref:Lipoprotein n=1 Tax=Pararhodospirillum oryzae TaxID=478448 RepID=A0A512H7J6_9PROT|nr:hypothetical protein [Pararhodospirillum oryzae]GEO81435.1 hypothetical protein ROR02_15660 [Pararhodospirillum oryzae]
MPALLPVRRRVPVLAWVTRVLPLVALPLLAGGCAEGTGSGAAGERLPLACAMMACECVNADAGPFTLERVKPVQWNAQGEATCPAGHLLRRKR